MKKQILFISILLLAGCSSIGTMDRAHRGMTSDQVKSEIGSPRLVISDSDGSERWIYRVHRSALVSSMIGICTLGFGALIPALKTDCWIVLQNNVVAEERKCSDQGRANAGPGPASFSNDNSAPSPSGIMHCGMRPIAKIGCHVGDCIDGHWQQNCN